MDSLTSLYSKPAALVLGLAASWMFGQEFSRKQERRSCKSTLFLTACILTILFCFNQVLYLDLDLDPSTNLRGKNYLVTGCTPGGIGHAIASKLAEWHADRVVCTVRSMDKGLELKLPSNVEFRVVELGNFDSVRALATTGDLPPFDGIVLNAGMGTANMELTDNGFEQMYQVNHLSQFLLLRLLLQSKGAIRPNARVVFVSSTAYLGLGVLDRTAYARAAGRRMQDAKNKNVLGTYADSKLMQILTARALTKRYGARTDPIFVSACPGFVSTNFQEKMPKDLSGRVAHETKDLLGRTPLQGAARMLQLLTSRELPERGKFYDAYIPLPLGSEVNADNVEWLYETSSRLVAPWL